MEEREIKLCYYFMTKQMGKKIHLTLHSYFQYLLVESLVLHYPASSYIIPVSPTPTMSFRRTVRNQKIQ